MATKYLLPALGAVVALVLAPAAHGAEFSVSKEVVGYYETTTSVGPDQLPLVTPEDGDRPRYIVRQIGPISLDAGDCIDVRGREQFSNTNPAQNWWNVGGIQSEHWMLWVGVDIGIRYVVGVPPNDVADGSSFLRQSGENWDGFMRRFHWDGTEIQCFSSAVSNLYLFTTVGWYTSAYYRVSDSGYITNDKQGKLEVVHYGLQ